MEDTEVFLRGDCVEAGVDLQGFGFCAEAEAGVVGKSPHFLLEDGAGGVGVYFGSIEVPSHLEAFSIVGKAVGVILCRVYPDGDGGRHAGTEVGEMLEMDLEGVQAV